MLWGYKIPFIFAHNKTLGVITGIGFHSVL